MHGGDVRTAIQQGILDLRKIREGLLGKPCRCCDSDNFRILGLEFWVCIIRTGCLQALYSGTAEIEDIEIDQDISSAQIAELELPALCAFELKIGSFVTYLKSLGGACGRADEGKRDQQRQESLSCRNHQKPPFLDVSCRDLLQKLTLYLLQTV